MGGLLSRWRAKPSTVEVLESMEKEILSLEEFREKNQRLRKIWVGRLLIYSSVVYLITCLIVYCWYLPEEWTARLLMALPFFTFPIIVWMIRTLLIIWFSKRTERNNDALEDLKCQKKKILEEVMEKETYKSAKLILERFDPDSKKAKELEQSLTGTSSPRPGQELRQRNVVQRNPSASTPTNPNQGSPQAPAMHVTTPGLQKDAAAPGGPPERTAQQVMQSNMLARRPGSPMLGMGLHPPGPPLARPILPRERGALDRVVEYLVGDGPQNRYALICQQCFSHNGMALKEEFEYVAFRCAYCYFLNPARKTRPHAPRLQEINFEQRPLSGSQVSVGHASGGGADDGDNQPSDDPVEDSEKCADGPELACEVKDSSTEQQCDTLTESDEGSVSSAKEDKSPATNGMDHSEESLMETE
ncbi:endoplasmic reticulum junction formation protein lunapark [Ambystoma mexicanum]|uniref:endoplasmic reticulum junction formation protein lunapark n=1 Tax=Ambystoma mexicanum TaxID=8296 RepID=UPI0037E74FBB